MGRFKVEFTRRGGWDRVHTRTVRVPRGFQGDLQYYIQHKIHLMMEPEPEYRHTYPAFWREWILLQFWKE